MAQSKIKALLTWCQKMTSGYPNVQMDNFTTAWRDGLAFCAIIHRFRPDLIDFESLSPENVFDNCRMAFEIAERDLSIPAFLEAEDMVRLRVPDKLSIITYVSQYYNYLHALPQLGGPGVKSKVNNKTTSGTKRPSDSKSYQVPVTKKASTSDIKASVSDIKASTSDVKASAVGTKENLAPTTNQLKPGGEKCAICQNHVYLMERHMDQGKLYHRSCFRHSELSPANKVYTRSPFLSKSLSSDSSACVNSESKSSYLAGDASKTLTSSKQVGVDRNVRQKHPLDDPDREDAKKSRFQPRTLFGEDKEAAVKDVASKSYHTKGSDNLLGPHFSNERRQEAVLTSEKSVEQPKSIRLHMPLIFQDKPTSNTPKTTATNLPASTAAPTAEPPAESRKTPSKTFRTPLLSQEHSNTAQPEYKLTGSKDNEKHSHQVRLDINSTHSDVLPSVQNLQKMFSGKSNGDNIEQTKPPHPVARPRGSTLRSAGEDATPVKPKDEKNMAPKPAHRKNVQEADTVIKKSSLHTNSFVDHIVSSKSSNGTALSPTSNLPSSQSVTSTTLSEAASRQTNYPSATGLLQEKKDSLHPARHLQNFMLDTFHNTPNKTSSDRATSHQTSVNTISNQTVSEHLSSKQHPAAKESEDLPVSHFTPKVSDKKWLPDKVQVSSAAVPALKEKDSQILSGLLTSLAGVKGHSYTPTSNIRAAASTPPSNVREKTEMTFNSSPQTSSNKAVSATSTTLHLLPQTNRSVDYKDSSNASSTNMIQSKSNKETTKTEHRHSLVSTSKASVQTTNKDATTVGPFALMKGSNAGTVSKCSTTNIELTKPGKINNGFSKPSHHTDEHKQSVTSHKHGAASKVLSEKINQNRTDNSSITGQHNLKANDKKTESGDSEKGTLRPALTNQSISIDESRGVTPKKHRALSSSMESLLDLNSVKLKSVMPESTKPQKEQRAALYDVKLKKVDVIKGDTKWDSAPEKPQRLQKGPEAVAGSKPVSGDKQGGTNLESHPLVTDQEMAGLSAELLLQNKDKEERHKDLTQSRSVFGQPEVRKDTKSRYTSTSSNNNFRYTVNKDNNTASHQVTTSHQSSLQHNEKDLITDLRAMKNGRKVSPTREKEDSNKKLDWQIEAEKRMAALATFSMKVSEHLKESETSDKQGNQENKKKSPAFHRSEGDLTSNHDQEFSHKQDISKASNQITGKKNWLGSHPDKGADKLKDSKMEFLLKQTKLKPIEVDIGVSSVEKTDKSNNDLNHHVLDKNRKGGDFREVFHQLKHVPEVESEKMEIIKTDIKPDNFTRDQPQIPANNKNENNNNKKVITEHSHMSDVEHILKLQNSGHSSGLVSSADENGNIRKPPIPDLSGERHPRADLTVEKPLTETGSSGRRKIPVQDMEKASAASPVPCQKLKKIELTTKFDFERSSDFEQSLTESTATLTLHDEHTDEALSPDSSSKMTPNKISALELQTQLLDIDSRLTQLELKGRELEEAIREVNDNEDDELMIKWFSLINEKNDLVRNEEQLIYLSKEMELESKQEKIDSQLQYLLKKPDEMKSPEEKEEEEYLIQHKLELVEQRNMIVDSIDEDRIMHEAEDKGIESILKLKGYWKDSSGTLKAIKGKKVARSIFYI